jgi:hypothetical protein
MNAGQSVCPDRGGKSPFTEGIGAPLMLVDKRENQPFRLPNRVFNKIKE